jgi:putative Holliday junction resolvase
MPDTPERGATVLAFDFGLRRIGVAVGQSITASASPLGVVANGDDGPDFETVAKLISEWQPSELVVGMPSHADGSPSEMREPVEAFIAALGQFQLPTATVDERYTSVEAEAVLKSARSEGRRGRIKKDEIDAAAAVLIAERYLAHVREVAREK